MDNKTVINPAVANTPATVINNEVVAEYNRQNQIDIESTTMLSAGTVVCDRYKIQNQLEVSSGEADLYLCSDGRQQFVAKIYKRKFAVKQEVSEALRRIDSPYVAKLYETGSYNGYPVEILPFYERGSLQGHTFTEDEIVAICDAAGCKQGDVLLIIADGDSSKVLTQLGQLRVEAANRLGVEREGFKFLWVVEMPFFEYDAESGEYVAMHHPFTSPLDECVEYLETDKAKVRAKAYDLVLNGIELSSGSIRITEPALQAKIFSLLGLSEEEASIKFGYLLEAFKYGAPPHGGMALGLDRLVMQMLGASSLRDVVAFPKVQNAKELMTDCPAEVPQASLDDLGIGIIK